MDTTPKQPIVYVVPDIERALGREPGDDYFIVANRTAYAERIFAQYPQHVMLVDGDHATSELLALAQVRTYINDRHAKVMVFIGNSIVERTAEKNGLDLIHPKAELAAQIEGKISQIEWLGDLASLMPEYTIGPLKNLSYNNQPFILQFGFSHTGEGTHLIDSASALTAFQDKFPERLARTLRYVKGTAYTVNAVVSAQGILVGNTSLQITGLAPYTDLPFSTVGNDWAIPHILLSEQAHKEIRSIAESVGKRLLESGWRGLFGIDVIHEEHSGRIYLIEINARQPASTTLESQLQRRAGATETIFDAHLRALCGERVAQPLTEIRDGAQIVQRVTRSRTKESIHIDMHTLEAHNLDVIRYEKDDHNSDLVRITSPRGIMSSPSELNDLGKIITSSIS